MQNGKYESKQNKESTRSKKKSSETLNLPFVLHLLSDIPRAVTIFLRNIFAFERMYVCNRRLVDSFVMVNNLSITDIKNKLCVT